MILGRDHQIADGRVPGRIAALILVEECEEARFELFESRLPDARDHGREGRAGIAQQLSEVTVGDGGEGSEQPGEFGFADGRARPCPTL